MSSAPLLVVDDVVKRFATPEGEVGAVERMRARFRRGSGRGCLQKDCRGAGGKGKNVPDSHIVHSPNFFNADRIVLFGLLRHRRE